MPQDPLLIMLMDWIQKLSSVWEDGNQIKNGKASNQIKTYTV